MQITLPILKTGLILFWSVWLSIVFLTNVLAALKALGLLPEDWRFASSNYQAVADTISEYSWPRRLAGVLFLGVILWQGLAVLLFWQAFFRYQDTASTGLAHINTAFGVSLGLWAAFMIADELFTVYRQESAHVLFFIGQLVTLLAIHLLP
jgi:hypothetical protein